MPILIETMKTPPDNKDYQSLLKIYQDFPKHYVDKISPGIGVAGFIDYLLNANKATGYMGRFNSQIITSFFTIPQGQDIELLGLCVRDITRNRGVAQQFLTLFAKNMMLADTRYFAHIDHNNDFFPIIMHVAKKLGAQEITSNHSKDLAYCPVTLLLNKIAI